VILGEFWAMVSFQPLSSAFLLDVQRVCDAIEGRLSHFQPRWLRRGWHSVISQGTIPWNTPPRLGIEPGPRWGQRVRFIHFPTELSWPTSGYGLVKRKTHEISSDIITSGGRGHVWSMWVKIPAKRCLSLTLHPKALLVSLLASEAQVQHLDLTHARPTSYTKGIIWSYEWQFQTSGIILKLRSDCKVIKRYFPRGEPDVIVRDTLRVNALELGITQKRFDCDLQVLHNLRLCQQ